MSSRQPQGEALRRELELALKIDKNDLDEELIRQPEFYYRAANEYAMAESNADAAEVALKEARATAWNDIRLRSRGEEKAPSDKLVEAQVTLDKRVREAQERHLFWSREAALWLAAKDSWKQRDYAMQHLVNLFVHQYYNTGSAGSKAISDAKERVAARVREEQGAQRENYPTRRRGS